MTNPILLVTAHPDDELITFGALTISNLERLHILCLTVPEDEERIASFGRFCTKHSIPHQLAGIPDHAHNNIHTLETINEISQYIQLNGISKVYTHDPITGDQGRHLHHQQTGLMAGAAAFNTGVPVEFLHYEGFAETSSTASCTADSYMRLVHELNEFYADEYAFIQSQQRSYPISDTLRFYTMTASQFSLYHSYYASDWLNDWSAAAVHGNTDLSFTSSSDFELTKRAVLLEMIGAALQTSVASTFRNRHLIVADVGTGHGLTTQAVVDMLRQQTAGLTLLCYDPFMQPLIPCDKHHVDLDELKTHIAKIRSSLKDTFVLVTGYQAFQYVSDSTREALLLLADGWLLDTMEKENVFQQLCTTFPNHHLHNRTHIGVRTHLAVQSPYTETVALFFGSRK